MCLVKEISFLTMLLVLFCTRTPSIYFKQQEIGSGMPVMSAASAKSIFSMQECYIWRLGRQDEARMGEVEGVRSC